MKRVSALLLTVIAVCSADPSLRVRWGLEIWFGSNYFVECPQSLSDAVDAGWTEMERPEGPLESLVMYCYDDRIICTLFDDTEYIAGFQIGLPVDEFKNPAYDWDALGFTEWNATTKDGTTKTFRTLQQYYVDEDFLAQSPEDRIAARDSSKLLQAGGVWLTGFNKELRFVSSNEKDITDSSSVFTEQACILAMGTHYYYQMSANLTCSDTTIYPWFPLMYDETLVATGFMVFGSFEENKDRDWFERPTASDVKMIVPRGPECLYNLAENPGVLTMHVYYVDRPRIMFCF